LVHRSALERMRDFIPKGGWPRRHARAGKRGFSDTYPWFQEMEHDGQPVGEDITFCWRAAMAGIPVYVNTAVQMGHVKRRLLDMDAYLIERGLLSPVKPGGGQ
jgi:hypothetical protein